MAHSLNDADITDRLPTLTSTPLDTAAKRTAKVRTPAAAIIDAWFPFASPFADISASPSTPALIKAGAIEVAVFLALRILAGDPSDTQAAVAWETAKLIFQIDAEGRANVQIPGVDTAVRFAVVDVTRSIDDEDRDEDVNRRALYP